MAEQYQNIETILSDGSSPYCASGCQGVICGVLVFGDPSPISRWIDEVIEDLDESCNHGQKLRLVLAELAVITQQCLGDLGINFVLLLPEEDLVPLKQRVEALSGWCEGFLYGLSLAGLSDKTYLSAQSGEIIKDVLEISQVFVDSSHNEANEVEADEVAYFEVVEYLRICVLLLAAELQSSQPRS